MEKLKNYIYIYRYDIFALSMMFLLITWFLSPILSPGHVVFSDIDFGFSSERYMGEIAGLWNERWSTSTLLNVPRLLYILPFWGLSMLFGGSGPLFIKSFIFGLIFLSSLSMYLFGKRITSVYFTRHFNIYSIFALLTGSLFYALNPWVIFRIQHIYLLCGYSLLPMVLLFFFNAFDPRFQKQLIKKYSPFTGKVYRRNIIDLFLMTLFFTISAAAIHYFFFTIILFLMLGFLLLVKIIWTGRKNRHKWKAVSQFLKKIFIFVLFFVLLSGYWFFMYAGSILFQAQASQNNINVVDTLSLFSKNSSVKNVVFMVSYWWPMFNLNELGLMFLTSGGILLLIIFYGALKGAFKHNIILFFSLLSMIFVVLSTGTTINSFANIFVMIVTKTPIIGTMFRDPNKFVGLMAVGFSILLIYGVQSILRKANTTLKSIFNFLVIGIVISCFIVYIAPMYNHFINGFYYPVKIPEDYLEVQDNFIDPDEFDSRVLYMPIADNMIQSYVGIATPYWNINNDLDGIAKATGDLQVYSSSKNTVFHHEGNTLSINYYMNFLQDLVDKGLTLNLGELSSVFGINELAYHDEYLDQEERQNLNLEILSLQKDLTLHYENDIFSLYELDNPLPYFYNVPGKIYTPYGLTRMVTLSLLPRVNFKDFGMIFTALDEKSYIQYINEGDYIEVKDYNDLLLSELPEEYYLRPFDFINDGNAFLKWSKTLLKNSEWIWYLTSQSMYNFMYDYDFGDGTAVTFASAKLDVPAYKMNEIEGKTIMDFNTMLRLGNFFMPDNEEIYSVEANPNVDTNAFPTVQGRISQGDPKNIWQVAKSGLMIAKENNPYMFSLAISGRGVNKLHVKVRFYDSQMNELGITYVVASEERVNFNELNFHGEYVSPPDTSYMRMDLLAFQRPDQKTYWWIHDLEIKDLEEYKADNTFTMNKNFENELRAKVFVRLLKSARGGNISVDLCNEKIIIDTQNESRTFFQWVDIGEFNFKAGDNNIIVENLKGFNAVNLFAVIPLDDLEEIRKPVDSAIDKTNLFATFEAEGEFQKNCNIQSERTFPYLSMGEGISISKGSLSTYIDISKTSEYSFNLGMSNIPTENGTITLQLISESTKLNIPISISNSDIDRSTLLPFIDYDPLSSDYPAELKLLPGIMPLPEYYISEATLINKGKYNLILEVDSGQKSLSTLESLHLFSPSEVIAAPFFGDEIKGDCCDCVQITEDMSNIFFYSDEEEARIEYQKTCSCDWYDYASNFIQVVPDHEYLYDVIVKSENVKERHMKVLFLDKFKNIIHTEYISEIEEKYKDRENKYEQIVKAPEDSKYMQFHILARGGDSYGYTIIKDYQVYDISSLVCIDNLIIIEGNDLEKFFTTKKPVNAEYVRNDSMKRTIEIENPQEEILLLNYMESPNPLWEISLGEKQRAELNLNGVSTGIFTTYDGEGQIKVILRELYFIGIFFFFLGFIVFFIILKINKNK